MIPSIFLYPIKYWFINNIFEASRVNPEHANVAENLLKASLEAGDDKMTMLINTLMGILVVYR